MSYKYILFLFVRTLDATMNRSRLEIGHLPTKVPSTSSSSSLVWTMRVIVTLLLALPLIISIFYPNGAAALSREQKRCAEVRINMTRCRLTRERVLDCLFEQFAPKETPDDIPVQVLRDAWVYLLNDSQRALAGSVDNVIEVCNPTNATTFNRQEMLANDCYCMQDCYWTTKVQVVCGLAITHPNWRDNIK